METRYKPKHLEYEGVTLGDMPAAVQALCTALVMCLFYLDNRLIALLHISDLSGVMHFLQTIRALHSMHDHVLVDELGFFSIASAYMTWYVIQQVRFASTIFKILARLLKFVSLG